MLSHESKLNRLKQPTDFIDGGYPHYNLVTTETCNFNCYCFREGRQDDFSYEELREVVDAIFSRESLVSLSFYGGEPLLRFEIVKRLYEYIEAHYASKVLSYSICTNASIMTEPILDFLVANKDKIVVACSLDGLRASNAARVLQSGDESFDVVVANIKRMFEAGANIRQVQYTAHRENVGDITEGVAFLYELGFRAIDAIKQSPTVDPALVSDDEYTETFFQGDGEGFCLRDRAPRRQDQEFRKAVGF